jgi:hypothetical protein
MSALHSDLGYTTRLSGKGHIRLLKVLPEVEGSQEIHCELENANLENSPKYIAISYTWGPPTPEAEDARLSTSTPAHTVRCNGNIMPIPWNLHDFLRRASRDSDLTSQRLWIDCLCINQHDHIERTSQVSFMASIYRSAEMVMAWLGEEDAYTKDSFSLIRTLTSLSGDQRNQIMPKNMGSEAFRSLLGGLADARVWNSLRQFWRRRYFRRAWIIQEVILAKKVTAMCGGYTIAWELIVQMSLFSTVTPWTRFLSAEAHDPIDPKYSNHGLPLYLNTKSNLKRIASIHPLLYALIWARRFECSDPRDKVYAVLGLAAADLEQKPRLRPVYGDRSVTTTYTSVAIQILEDTDNLLLLAHSEGQDFHKIKGLPSWVPDWSCASQLGLGMAGYLRFAASGSMTRSLVIDESDMSLSLHGLRLDRVAQVGESKDEALIYRKPEYFPGWISILSALPPVYHNGQPKSEVFWRTLITDTAARIPHPARHPAAQEYRIAFTDWIARIILRWTDEPSTVEKKSFLEGLDHLISSEETGLAAINTKELDSDSARDPPSIPSDKLAETSIHNPPDADDYDAILSHSSQTRLIRTSANYLGIGTTSTKEGDSVWIIPGSRIPLIFRETGSRNEYHLVGGAYVHGFMHGEALTHDTIFEKIKVL